MLYVDETLHTFLRIAFFGSDARGACLRMREVCGGVVLLLALLWRDIGLVRMEGSRFRSGRVVVLLFGCRGMDVRRYCISPLDQVVGVGIF